VSLILDFLASGMNIDEILTEYPHLEVEDVRAALGYGAEMTRERYVEIPVEAIG
jgi:uncharacterized protein (DUF433 family)